MGTSVASILLSIAGPEVTGKIMQTFGGENIYIPRKNKEGRDDVIKHEFHDLLDEGATCMSSYKQLGKRHELSPRRIMAIVNS